MYLIRMKTKKKKKTSTTKVDYDVHFMHHSGVQL